MNPAPASSSSKPLCAFRGPASEAGIGLIDVMIAVLVLSIGIFGIAALQMRALGNNNSSMAQSMAAVASYSILEAMRADRSTALAGTYNTATPIAANACPAAGTSLSTVQINTWCGQLGSYLGAVSTTTGSITCNSSALCTIIVSFNDSNGTGISTQTITTQAGL